MHAQTTEMKTAIVVVGAGRWGNHLVRNFLNHPNAHLLAVVDRNNDRLQSIGERYQLSASQRVNAQEWDTVLKCQEVDAVAIATPASTHYGLIESALRHGKHVFVEKPLTVNPKEALELCDLAHACERQLIVDHTYLFNAAVEAGQQWIQHRKLGNLRYGYATRTHLGPIRQDVDALWDLAIHDISIFSHWFKEFPCQVQAHGKIWLQPTYRTSTPDNSAETIHHDSLLFPKGLADQVWIILRYPSGIEASIHLCWANPDKQRRLCVVGEQGTLIFDELHSSPLRVHPGQLQEQEQGFIPNVGDPMIISTAKTEPLSAACDHFLCCIRKNQSSTISSGPLGAKFVEILWALTESLNKGGTPIFLNVQDHALDGFFEMA